ncbi:MAG TPA: hypothetical protein VGB88_10285, partial [Alphaproteobacteria bacterium]
PAVPNTAAHAPANTVAALTIRLQDMTAIPRPVMSSPQTQLTRVMPFKSNWPVGRPGFRPASCSFAAREPMMQPIPPS